MILNDKTLFKDLFIKEDVNSFMTTKKSSLAAIVKPLLEQKNKIVRARQTHSENVAIIDDITEKNILSISDCDALITNLKNTYLSIKVADCMPILIYHKSGWIAAIHAGREGTIKKILYKTLKSLLTLTNKEKDYHVWFGPCICVNCHQINKKTNTCYNLLEENTIQLKELLPDSGNSLYINKMCTRCNSNHLFHSYRGDNYTKKRNYIFIGLK